MGDVSGYGLSFRLKASNTFPFGLDVTQFSDDSDPLDVPEMDIADHGMGLNGDLVTWTTANPILVTVNVIAGSDDDKNLRLLFEANRAGRNKTSAKDVITGVLAYPDGEAVSLLTGVCKSFVPARGANSDGKLKSRPYTFAFENQVTVG